MKCSPKSFKCFNPIGMEVLELEEALNPNYKT